MQLAATARDLPEELALPLASGAEWWYWLGGRPAVDLVNTLRERWRRRVETLVTPDDLGLWLVHAGTRPRLAPGPDGAPVLGERRAADSPRRAVAAIALDAAEMLGRADERVRVRVCASDTCSARFYDRSPAGRRRWCSMRSCGNEAKARRHRERARGAA